MAAAAVDGWTIGRRELVVETAEAIIVLIGCRSGKLSVAHASIAVVLQHYIGPAVTQHVYVAQVNYVVLITVDGVAVVVQVVECCIEISSKLNTQNTRDNRCRSIVAVVYRNYRAIVPYDAWTPLAVGWSNGVKPAPTVVAVVVIPTVVVTWSEAAVPAIVIVVGAWSTVVDAAMMWTGRIAWTMVSTWAVVVIAKTSVVATGTMVVEAAWAIVSTGTVISAWTMVVIAKTATIVAVVSTGTMVSATVVAVIATGVHASMVATMISTSVVAAGTVTTRSVSTRSVAARSVAAGFVAARLVAAIVNSWLHGSRTAVAIEVSNFGTTVTGFDVGVGVERTTGTVAARTVSTARSVAARTVSAIHLWTIVVVSGSSGIYSVGVVACSGIAAVVARSGIVATITAAVNTWAG